MSSSIKTAAWGIWSHIGKESRPRLTSLTHLDSGHFLNPFQESRGKPSIVEPLREARESSRTLVDLSAHPPQLCVFDLL